MVSPSSVYRSSRLDEIVQTEIDKLRVPFFPTHLTLPHDVASVVYCLHRRYTDEAINVNIVLEHCGIRMPDIHGRFRAYVKTSIRRYLEGLRLITALRLLRYRELGVRLIAAYVGYANYRSFVRAFRRRFGCTPTSFREAYSPVVAKRFEEEAGLFASCLHESPSNGRKGAAQIGPRHRELTKPEKHRDIEYGYVPL